MNHHIFEREQLGLSKERLFHITILKIYCNRALLNNACGTGSFVDSIDIDCVDRIAPSVVELPDDEQEMLSGSLSVTPRETYIDVDINPKLSSEQIGVI